ncbi:hypothetical protein HPB48_021651 [Haemaphysalis longicornis]|uniref:Uncharacterized protein n=1 Tax=Haemaphysalis longicornis TaxID=44386 RepID=A0A9J6GSU3_HAELO|nr:hypothetical protein HPB48_021651 [Haemaphysalis longicornis]
MRNKTTTTTKKKHPRSRSLQSLTKGDCDRAASAGAVRKRKNRDYRGVEAPKNPLQPRRKKKTKRKTEGGGGNHVCRGEGKKKTRLPGRARVRHHRENCGKQTWRSSEWAASQAQPKSAKSELRQPGRQKPRQPGRRKKPRLPGRHETASAGAARKLRQPGRKKKKKTRLPGQARVRHHRENCGKQTWRSSVTALPSSASYPEGNFGGNQLLDGSIGLSPLYPDRTIDLHVRIASDLHQSFLWPRPARA